MAQVILRSRLDRNLEAAYIVLVLMWLAGATLYYDFGSFQAPEAGGLFDRSAGDRRVQVITLALYSFGILYVAFNVSNALGIVLRNKALFGLLGVVFASSLWSILPWTSFRRAIALALSTVFALYVVQRHDPRTLLRLVCIAIFACSIVALILVVIAPDIATFTRDGKTIWRGMWGQKNEAGRVTAIGIMSFFVLTLLEKRLTPFSASGLLICATILVMSQSKTALITAVVSCAFVAYVRLLPGRRAFTQAALVCLGMATFLAIVITISPFLQQIATMLGRDLTLSNRTDIWASAIEVGSTRPILGFGFRAFWTDAGVNATSAIHFAGRELGNGHSGYLDIWLELGIVGVIGCIFLIVVVIRRTNSATVDTSATRSEATIWIAAVTVFLSVYSISEKVILEHTDLLWFLFTTCVLYTTPLTATKHILISATPKEQSHAAKHA